ncbi:metallophosphoesterase family protein [Gaoshiqia sp. Z1-71]|uniref:metallophosphoesterase family protein n=1 Tax=Gaoshiqia hydrogeniformans TaxID=3290090 RepID=UPI003BF7B160
MQIRLLILICLLFSVIHGSVHGQRANKVVRIGLCTDVHLPTMHDAEFRINAFMDHMKAEKPDFIIELGDFAEASEKFVKYYELWNTFPGDKYHVIGNHEMDGGHSREEALAYRNMKNSYYSFDKKGFHFIVLDGNDKKDENAKGYKQYMGPTQLEWLRNDLSETKFPVVIFSHQGLVVYKGVDENYGVENAAEVREIIDRHNLSHPDQKVIACFNGHTHWDYAEKIKDVWYIHITSMSYHWLGVDYATIRYSGEVDKNFKWIKYTAPFKDPLFTMIEISDKGGIKIEGKKSEWVGPSPFEIGYPEEMKRFMRPAITKRALKF